VSKRKLDRIGVAGLLMFAAGLHLYGWFAAEMDMLLLPLSSTWTALSYLSIAFGLIIALVIAKSTSKHLEHNLVAIGFIMCITSYFTALVYSQKHGVRESLITGVMHKMYEMQAPPAPYVLGLFISGLAIITAVGIVKAVRR